MKNNFPQGCSAKWLRDGGDHTKVCGSSAAVAGGRVKGPPRADPRCLCWELWQPTAFMGQVEEKEGKLTSEKREEGSESV